MNTYLAGYGEKDLKRRKLIRWILISAVAAVVLVPLLYLRFRDFNEDRQMSSFVAHLKNKDYKAAYALWGCTDQKPCHHYPFEEFMKDWGPNSVNGAVNQAEIAGRKSCEDGTINFLRVPARETITVWVNRDDQTLGFAPWKLKSVPPGFKRSLQEWMWEVTRNCQPLIEP